jgi:hypothetical protein
MTNARGPHGEAVEAARAPGLLLGLVVASATLVSTRGAQGQQRLRVSGERLLAVDRRFSESEGDRHALRTRLPESPLSASSIRCASLPLGRAFGTPTPLRDRRVAVTTQSPAAIHWIEAGRVTHSVAVGAALLGTALEGSDGRIVVTTDAPAIHVYTPDGSLRATRELPARPLSSGAARLNDGTLLIPVTGRFNTDVLVMTPDLDLQARVPLNGAMIHTYMYRGPSGALWFNTPQGPGSFDGERAVPEPLRWASGAYAAWQTDEDTLVVQYGANLPAELRFTSRAGLERGRATLQGNIFLLPRGHLALTRPVTDTSAPTQGAQGGVQTPPSPPPIPRSSPFGRPAVAPPTHTELTLLDRRGAVISRALLPPRTVLGALLDPDDSLLAIDATGQAFHIDPGGTIRWQTSLGIPPEVDVIALPWGGFAMNTQSPRPAVCVYEP